MDRSPRQRYLQYSCGLEDKFPSELQTAPADSVVDDVGSTEVAIAPVGVKRQAAELVIATDVRRIDIDVRNAKPLMVEQIERLGLQLECKAFRNPCVLEDCEVDRAYRLASLGVTTHSEEWRAEELCGIHVIHDPTHLAQGGDSARR